MGITWTDIKCPYPSGKRSGNDLSSNNYLSVSVSLPLFLSLLVCVGGEKESIRERERERGGGGEESVRVRERKGEGEREWGERKRTDYSRCDSHLACSACRFDGAHLSFSACR